MVETLIYLPHPLWIPGMKVESLSHVWLFATPWTVARQAPPSMGFSRQEYWSGLPFSSPGSLPWPRNQTQVSCIAGRVYRQSHQGIPYTRHRFPQWGKRELYIILIDFKLTCKLILVYYLSREELLNRQHFKHQNLGAENYSTCTHKNHLFPST